VKPLFKSEDIIIATKGAEIMTATITGMPELSMLVFMLFSLSIIIRFNIGISNE
jgi:hypothetical protein